MLSDMQVQHPLDQCPLQLGPISLKHVKAAPGDFHPSLEVQDRKLWSEIPMGKRCEIELAPVTFLTENYIFALVLSNRDRIMRKVWNFIHRFPKPGLFITKFRLQLLYAVIDFAHRLDQSLPLITSFHSADSLGGLVSVSPQTLKLLQDFPALQIQSDNFVDWCFSSEAGNRALDPIGVGSDVLDIDHDRVSSQCMRPSSEGHAAGVKIIEGKRALSSIGEFPPDSTGV